MPNVTPHKLQHLQMDPPRETWDRIATRLDQEFDPQEISMSQKVGNWEATPPAGAWESIATTLAIEEEVAEPPSKVISIPYRKLAIAAVLAGIISLVTWNMMLPDTTGNTAAAISSNTNAGDATNHPLAVPVVPPDVPPVVEDDTRRDAKDIIAATQQNHRNNASSGISQNTSIREQDHEASLTDLQTQELLAPANVRVSPIRDAGGNIVMDVNLIKSPGNNYITVTGPNGEQTRISSKFLSMLPSLNSTVDKSEYFDNSPQQSSVWKKKFHEWRNKLMQQASFAPSATNFLDILELKELLEEK